MDNVTIDLGPETDVEPGAPAVLIGAQGSERILGRGDCRLGSRRSTTRSPAGSPSGYRGRSGNEPARARSPRAPSIAAARTALEEDEARPGSWAARSATPCSVSGSRTPTWRSSRAARRAPRARSRRVAGGSAFQLSEKHADLARVAPDGGLARGRRRPAGGYDRGRPASPRLHRQRDRDSAGRRRSDRSDRRHGRLRGPPAASRVGFGVRRRPDPAASGLPALPRALA